MSEFVPFPKIPRLVTSCTVTEKIDGTNAAVVIDADGNITAQSRNRIITPGKLTDNAGQDTAARRLTVDNLNGTMKS